MIVTLFYNASSVTYVKYQFHLNRAFDAVVDDSLDLHNIKSIIGFGEPSENATTIVSPFILDKSIVFDRLHLLLSLLVVFLLFDVIIVLVAWKTSRMGAQKTRADNDRSLLNERMDDDDDDDDDVARVRATTHDAECHSRSRRLLSTGLPSAILRTASPRSRFPVV